MFLPSVAEAILHIQLNNKYHDRVMRDFFSHLFLLASSKAVYIFWVKVGIIWSYVVAYKQCLGILCACNKGAFDDLDRITMVIEDH